MNKKDIYKKKGKLEDDMRLHYDFDYSEARSNRFIESYRKEVIINVRNNEDIFVGDQHLSLESE